MIGPSRPFRAQPAKTATLSVTTATGSVALLGQATEYRIFNAGAAIAFIEFGSSTITAAVATGIPIPSGAVEIYRPPIGVAAPYLAGITASGTATVYATPGEGF